MFMVGSEVPRMYGARAKVSMTSMGAPQCRHTKVGRTRTRSAAVKRWALAALGRRLMQ